MTDYLKSTGSTGEMMIRDNGTTVEFWIKAGPLTYDNNMPWKSTINGSTSGWHYFAYTNSGSYMKVATFTITYTQTVTFYLGDTNTSGLGGPTTHSHLINRDTVPDAPTINTVTVLSSTSIRVQWSDAADNGGDTVDSRRIGYGTSSIAPTTYISSDRDTTITGLTPGTIYYFWAQTHNSEGYSARSVRKTATTWKVPGAPSTPVLTEVAQDSLIATFTVPVTGGTAILERQLSYGITNTASTTTATSDGSTALTNLPAGNLIYVKARARNVVGWGAWSAISSAQLIAGAYVKVDLEWKRAVPYVKHNGVWEVSNPQVRIMGVQKGTG